MVQRYSCVVHALSNVLAACLLLCWRGVVSRFRSLVVLGVLLLASLAISVAVQVEIEVLRSSTVSISSSPPCCGSSYFLLYQFR